MVRYDFGRIERHLDGMTVIPPTGAILVLLSVHGQAQVTIRDMCPMRQHDVTETAQRHVDSTTSCA